MERMEADPPELAGNAGGARHGARARHIVLAVRLVQEGLAPLRRLLQTFKGIVSRKITGVKSGINR